MIAPRITYVLLVDFGVFGEITPPEPIVDITKVRDDEECHVTTYWDLVSTHMTHSEKRLVCVWKPLPPYIEYRKIA